MSGSPHKENCTRDTRETLLSEFFTQPSPPHILFSPFPWPLLLLYIYRFIISFPQVQCIINFFQLLTSFLFHSKLRCPGQRKQASLRNPILLCNAIAQSPQAGTEPLKVKYNALLLLPLPLTFPWEMMVKSYLVEKLPGSFLFETCLRPSLPYFQWHVSSKTTNHFQDNCGW